jgi:hypothetical protein
MPKETIEFSIKVKGVKVLRLEYSDDRFEVLLEYSEGKPDICVASQYIGGGGGGSQAYIDGAGGAGGSQAEGTIKGFHG